MRKKIVKNNIIRMNKWANHKFLSAEETNIFIKKKIEQGLPFMVCRIGANESFTMRTYWFKDKKNYKKALNQLCDCAGFFPNEQDKAIEFVDLMIDGIKQADICGSLLCPFDDFFIKRYLKTSGVSTILDYIDPIGKKNFWSITLKGKKVLVVHPFCDTIIQQYNKRKLIYPNKNYLPEFQLVTYKAIQTSAGQVDLRFSNWFEALNFMAKEISELDFDIALLGCGAYGLPLAAKIKGMGKQAIHIGGSLQIMFGIKGKRWDKEPDVAQLYNDAWVYPNDEETPSGAMKVENACYWK